MRGNAFYSCTPSPSVEQSPVIETCSSWAVFHLLIDSFDGRDFDTSLSSCIVQQS